MYGGCPKIKTNSIKLLKRKIMNWYQGKDSPQSVHEVVVPGGFLGGVIGFVVGFGLAWAVLAFIPDKK